MLVGPSSRSPPAARNHATVTHGRAIPPPTPPRCEGFSLVQRIRQMVRFTVAHRDKAESNMESCSLIRGSGGRTVFGMLTLGNGRPARVSQLTARAGVRTGAKFLGGGRRGQQRQWCWCWEAPIPDSARLRGQRLPVTDGRVPAAAESRGQGCRCGRLRADQRRHSRRRRRRDGSADS